MARSSYRTPARSTRRVDRYVTPRSTRSSRSTLNTMIRQSAIIAAENALREAMRHAPSAISSAISSGKTAVMDWMKTSRPRKLAVAKRYGGSPKGYYIPPGKAVKSRYIKRFNAKRRYNQGTFMYSLERGSQISPTVSGVIGHITSPRVVMQRVMFGALLRRLFVRAGLRCPIPSRAIEGVTTGDVVTFNFEYGSASLDGFSFTLTAGATFTQALNACVTDWNAKIASLTGSLVFSNTRFYKMSYTPSGNVGTPGRVEIDLTEAKIELHCASMLKIQNRSVGEVGDENADDVDNVPVQGKLYVGYGSGPDSRFQTDATTLVQLHGDANGVIEVSNPENMSDAPLPTLFNGVKKAGFIKIMPGQINRHYIKYKNVMYLTTFLRRILFATADSTPAVNLGKFAFVVLEKTLETNNGSPLAMTLSYEHQLNVTSKIVQVNADDPVPEYVRN